MSRKKPSPAPRAPSRIPVFAARHALALALGLMAIGGARIAATYTELGFTFDEPGHMACGLEYLARHVYRYEPQHPPLARVMTALGPYLDGARPLGMGHRDQEGVAQLYHYGHTGRTLTLMRLGILPFFFLGCMVVFWWARHAFGPGAAVAATALFTLLPPVLAHAGVATTDMALAACVGAAFYSLVRWAESPTLGRSVLFGAATAVAVLSKFTALGYLPAAAVLALVLHVAVERPGWRTLAQQSKRLAAPFAVAVAAGAVGIWAGYGFSFAHGVPAPELFEGLRTAMAHTVGGHPAYLLGEVSRTGWWYYFPVVLGVKTPIAFLLLVAMGVWICWKKRASAAYRLPVAFSLGILLTAMAGNVNIGVRHILPVYIGLSIVAGVALSELGNWKRWAAAVLVLWMAVSGAVRHPNYLAYFNEFVGGEPEKVLVDSDLDWGQDTVRLARRLRELGVNKISFATFGTGTENYEAWPGLPPVEPMSPYAPVTNWTAVSPTVWKLTRYNADPRARLWFEQIAPVERVGALLLYYVR